MSNGSNAMDFLDIKIPLKFEVQAKSDRSNVQFRLQRAKHGALGLLTQAVRDSVLHAVTAYNITIFELSLGLDFEGEKYVVTPQSWSEIYIDKLLTLGSGWTLKGQSSVCGVWMFLIVFCLQQQFDLWNSRNAHRRNPCLPHRHCLVPSLSMSLLPLLPLLPLLLNPSSVQALIIHEMRKSFSRL